MSKWEIVPAGSVTAQRKDIVTLEEGVEYRTMGVRWYGKGAYDRGTGTTETIKAKRLFRAHAGDFVFNRIDTQNGAFDVVSGALDGALATNEFPLYVANRERLLAPFLLLYFQQSAVLRQIDALRAGSEGRSRWKEADFEAWLIPLPRLAEQRRIVDVMSAIDAHIGALEVEAMRLTSTAVRLRDDIFGSLDSATVPAGQKFDMLLGRQKSARQSVGEHVLPYLRAANITAGSLKLTDVQTMNFDPREQEKYGLRVDDVVLVEGGSLGQAARWQGEIDGVVGFDKHVIRLRAREGFSTSEYALQWSHWARQTGQFDAQATGITIKALGFGRASAMPVPDLNLVEQARVTEPLAAADAEVAAVTAELTRLRACRSTFLAALLSQDFEIPESYDDLLASALEVAS